MEEQWKDIEGYNGLYQISNFGRVISFKYSKIRYLKPMINSSGYYYVNLYKNKTRNAGYIHMIVWDHFGNSKRNGRLLQVDHIDNFKTNNRIDNLQLLSSRENVSKHYLRTDKSSKFTGISWHKRHKNWMATIHINGKKKTFRLFQFRGRSSLSVSKSFK